MKKFLKKITEKGQGLTEYVLILAFIAGIAFLMFGGNGSLKGTLVSTANETNRLLGGLFGEKIDWGKMSRSDFNASNKEERLSADQTALMNLATFFIDKSYEEMCALLNGQDHGYRMQDKKDENGEVVKDANGKVIRENVLDSNGNPIPILNDGTNFTGSPLGWIVQTENGMHFITKELSSDPNDVYTFTNGNSTYSRNYNDQVLSWLQGDYSGNGKYDSSYTYMVSDYAVNQYDRLSKNELNYKNDPKTGGNGVKMRVEYNKPDNKDTSTWTVKSVKLVVDPGSQSEDKGAGISSGLEVMVKKNSSGDLEKSLTTGYTNSFK